MTFELNLRDLDEWVDETWHSGPPPSVGWWPASTMENESVIRWWNGTYWSFPLDRLCRPHEITLYSSLESSCQRTIRWRHRPKNWPAHSYT